MNSRLSQMVFVSISAVLLTSVVARAATVNVSIIGVSFVPKVITITNGDTIVWSGGAGVHTVSPGAGVAEPFCGGFAITSCSQTFTNTGSFSYRCNFHESSFSMTGQVIVVAAPPGGVPPVVSITNPPNGALFAAPATVPIGVEAGDADGTIAQVELLTNDVVAATSATAPFEFVLSNVAAGHYVLRAFARDNQSLRATSAPVQLRVVTPPQLVFDRGSNGPLQFQFNTVTGVNYVVEGTPDMTNFSAYLTNAGTGATQQFTPTNSGPTQNFFRVRLE
jgi:plastocyanin